MSYIKRKYRDIESTSVICITSEEIWRHFIKRKTEIEPEVLLLHTTLLGQINCVTYSSNNYKALHLS